MFWATIYLLYHLPENLDFSFFVNNEAKKPFVISSSHISSIVYIDSFEKETPPKENAPTMSSNATRYYKDSV